MPANSAPCIECPRPVYKHHLAVSCDLCDQWQHIKCVNIGRRNDFAIVAGSKGEGISCYYESDVDAMGLSKQIICTDNIRLKFGMPVVFQIDMVNTPPGYARLKKIKFDRGSIRPCFFSHLKTCLYELEIELGENGTFASSALLMSEMQGCYNGRYSPFFRDVSGPAFSYYDEEQVPVDRVHAFIGFCQKVLHPFRTRRRQHDWSPEDIIHDPLSTLCQLVPVGCKGSSNQWEEWRFCFILTEQKLIYSLNDTQLKVYILLKMIKSDILKGASSEISSYIMKNVTFWISEICGSQCFREENLLSLVLVGLKFLKDSIDNNYLPYYMIPARNLLAERLEPQTRRRLSHILSQVLKEGPRCVIRCSKLFNAMTRMYKSPERFNTYIFTRHTVELLVMASETLANYKRLGLFDSIEVDQQLDILNEKLHDILTPECVIGITIDCEIQDRRLKWLLS